MPRATIRRGITDHIQHEECSKVGSTVRPSGSQRVSHVVDCRVHSWVIPRRTACEMCQVFQADVLREEGGEEAGIGHSGPGGSESARIVTLPHEVFVPGQFADQSKEDCSGE